MGTGRGTSSPSAYLVSRRQQKGNFFFPHSRLGIHQAWKTHNSVLLVLWIGCRHAFDKVLVAPVTVLKLLLVTAHTVLVRSWERQVCVEGCRTWLGAGPHRAGPLSAGVLGLSGRVSSFLAPDRVLASKAP